MPAAFLRRSGKSLAGRLLSPFVGHEPADRLIRDVARRQWRLLAVNLGSSLMEALTEGATLGVIFLAVELLTAAEKGTVSLGNNPLLGLLPALGAWLNALPTVPLFLTLLALAVLMQAAYSLTRYVNLVSLGYFAARCRAEVTARIHGRILTFSYPLASRYRVGDLKDYCSSGPIAVQTKIELLGQSLVAVLLLAMYLTVLVRISPWLLLASLAVGVVVSAVQRPLLPRIRTGAQRVKNTEVEIVSRITEHIQGLRLLHSSGQLAEADRLVQAQMGQLEEALRNQKRLVSVITPVASFLPVLAIAVIASLSIFFFGGRATGVLPSLVTFVITLQRVNIRLGALANNLSRLSDNSARIDRLNEILSPAGKQFRRQAGVHFRKMEVGIQLEQVSLRYDPKLPLALSEISFSIPKGQVVALVGTSGAGKSSIADLLVGLYQPTAGRILVDGMELNALDLSSWQQRLGVVSQDTFLFNASLADNIAFGTPGADRSAVEAAAASAQALEFIRALPDGFDTVVGERGYRLSGGQRQRISLARAIVRNPEFLILDEATSALDSQSEKLVQEAIERFEHNHTILVIAHRLSTIVGADQILVLEAGRIIERGNHTSLLTNRGAYSRLWNQQLRAAIDL
jgi:ATP-binding cassette subfamily B protein/subfamily B ATP-binding cassette protein MsbA